MFAIILSIIAVIGVASAALVSYLSNTIVVTASVTSPVLLETSADGITYGTGALDMGSYYGGETVNYFMRGTNQGDGTVPGQMNIVVTNDINDVLCADFISIPAPWTCTQAGTAVNITRSGSFGPNEVWAYTQSLTFNPAVAPASYTFTSTFIV